MNQGCVLFLNASGAKLVGHLDEHRLGLGEENDATGLKIEAVRVRQVGNLVLDGPRGGTGDALMEQSHEVGPLRVVPVGRGEQSAGLV